jgi:hypothetical protein
MRTRMFNVLLMLSTIGLVSGCSSTMTASQSTAGASVSLGLMERGQDSAPSLKQRSSLCLMACDDLGQEMWLWEVVLAEQSRLNQLAGAE